MRSTPILSERYDSRPVAGEEGAFQVFGVPAGEYVVTTTELPPDSYEAEILADGTPLIDRRLSLAPGRTTLMLTVRAAFDGGVIEGSVEGGGEGAELAAALLPANYGAGQRAEQYTGIQNGSFQFRGVAPGAYVVAAVDRSVVLDWSSPERRAAFHKAGKAVRVGPRSTQTVTVPVVDGW